MQTVFQDRRALAVPLLTAAEAADEKGCSVGTIRISYRTRRLNAVRCGNRVYVLGDGAYEAFFVRAYRKRAKGRTTKRIDQEREGVPPCT